ncbi:MULTISPECIES: glycosyltransferase family 4 protein [Planococcus]|uniref:Glycosyltransferase family 1 protein n=1 Tax=Planococcus maitriensis TaxID=221799 RepID=A0A365KA47_9BACL|nr:glycosyltransferase family 4 protein [Planococcus maitriensis]RAZ69636.1 glycosyltransferase family 1 protein [Planococcus maitriensis]
MKILQVTAVDFTVKKFLLPLVDELDNKDYEVHIACNVNEIGEDLRNKGYAIKHIPFSRDINVFNHFKSLIKMVTLIRKEKYDIIHSHTPVASLITRLAAKITNVPLNVYTAHGFYFHENMKPFVYKMTYSLEKIWGKYLTDYIFFQSKEDYELALQKKFNKPDRLVHINNGVSGNKFNPLDYDRNIIRRELNVEGKKVILFIGRLVKEKGIRELLAAFEILSSKHSDLALLLVGGGVTGDRDGLSPQAIVDKMSSSVRQDIHLLGLRDDIPKILAASDVFTLPSYREGLPRSIIEAMAMGKPIVATDIRGCREEVFDGFNGYLCRDRDVDSLVSALERLLTNDDKLNDYGKQSRSIFLEEFEEQKVLDRQLRVFENFKINKK